MFNVLSDRTNKCIAQEMSGLINKTMIQVRLLALSLFIQLQSRTFHLWQSTSRNCFTNQNHIRHIYQNCVWFSQSSNFAEKWRCRDTQKCVSIVSYKSEKWYIKKKEKNNIVFRRSIFPYIFGGEYESIKCIRSLIFF